jgi:hypothetical protein
MIEGRSWARVFNFSLLFSLLAGITTRPAMLLTSTKDLPRFVMKLMLANATLFIDSSRGWSRRVRLPFHPTVIVRR